MRNEYASLRITHHALRIPMSSDNFKPRIDWSPLLRDGRLIRAAIIGFLGLIVLIYVARVSGIIVSSKVSHAIAPTPILIPTVESVEPSADDTIIFAGETLVREMATGELHLWEFTEAEGEVIDILVLAHDLYDSDFDLQLELFAPSGQLIAKMDDSLGSGPELLRGVVLPEAGTYTLWVSEADFDHAGHYQLTLLNNLNKAIYPSRVGLGQMLRSTLTRDETQFWVFSGDAEQAISATVFPLWEYDDDFRPILDIYTPEGEFLARVESAEPATTAVSTDIILPTSGSYTVWIADDGYDHEGIFALTLQVQGSKAERFQP